MRCVPASIGSNVAAHCFGCYHPKSWHEGGTGHRSANPKFHRPWEKGASATVMFGKLQLQMLQEYYCVILVPFHAASFQRPLWQGALMSTLRTSFPRPLLPPPVVCTLLPIGSCPAFQCCTQTDQLGIQHLNPRPYLWQPQIEHLYPSSTTETLWSCVVMLMVPPHSFGCNVTEAIWWQLLPGNPWTFSICSGHVGTMAWIEGSRTNGRRMC